MMPPRGHLFPDQLDRFSPRRGDSISTICPSTPIMPGEEGVNSTGAMWTRRGASTFSEPGGYVERVNQPKIWPVRGSAAGVERPWFIEPGYPGEEDRQAGT